MTKSRDILKKRTAWMDYQVEILRVRYPHEKTQRIADDLGFSLEHIYRKAQALGLKKTREFLDSPEACRLRRGDNIGAPYRFKPGQQTWNKGMKGLQIGGVETRFKKGQMPHNTAEVGAYRITKDGTLQRKIGTAKGSNSKRWRGVHELLWVEANGPVPPGHICVFKPGMKTAVLEEITIDRIECISLADNMRRNSYHNYGPEIAQVIQLKGAITRQINRRERNAK